MLQSIEIAQARSIRLHLINGTANGIICANSNHSALALRAPRSRIKDLCKLPEADRKGIYLLSGYDPDAPSNRKIYIGESDCLRLRIPIQDRKFDFFDQLIIVVGKDDCFSKDHYRYIESKLIRLTSRVPTMAVLNETDPQFDRLSQNDRIEAEEFISELLLLTAILGFDVFRPVDSNQADETAPMFETTVSGTLAFARETDDGFIVLANSTARIQESDSLPEGIRTLRAQMVRDKQLVADMTSGYFRFAYDTSFRSPSAAAAVVAGRSASGPLEWKVQTSNQTYREWLDANLESVRQRAQFES